VYDAPYPHSKLTEGTELKKDTVIGGDELYVLCGPHDPLPPSVTSISLDNILPVKGLSAPNADIAIYSADGLYQPEYEGPAKKLKQYQDFQQAQKKIWHPDRVRTFTASCTTKAAFTEALSSTSISETGYQPGDSYTLTIAVKRIVGQNTSLLLLLGDSMALWTQESAFYGIGGTGAKSEPTTWPSLSSDATPPYTWEIDCTGGFPTSNQQWYSFTTPRKHDIQWSAINSVYLTIGLSYNAEENTTILELTGGSATSNITTNRVILKNLHIALQDISNVPSANAGISAGTIDLTVTAAAIPVMDFPEENAIAHIRNVVCPNRVITACINEGCMARDMYLKLTNFLQRELLVGSVLATANLPVIIQSDAGSIDIPSDFTPVDYL
jgi:hypothetical protein